MKQRQPCFYREEFQRFYTVLRQIIRQVKKSWSTCQSSLAYWLPMTPIRIDPWLKSMRKLESELECVHCVYVEDVPPAVALPEGFVINRLDASHTQKIIALYRHSMESLANEQYIGECLQDGMYGAFYKGELCGFIGVHEQESIGILEVHPKWRRKGLAVALEQVMIGKQLERGRLPYGEIVKDNTASIRLQKKAGMITDEKLTYWYFP